MYSIIFARLDFNRYIGQIVRVVYQEIDFAVFLVVIVVQAIPVRTEFLCDSGFVYRPQIDASDVGKDSLDVVPVEYPRKYADIVQIQFQEIFPAVFDKRIYRSADRLR